MFVKQVLPKVSPSVLSLRRVVLPHLLAISPLLYGLSCSTAPSTSALRDSPPIMPLSNATANTPHRSLNERKKLAVKVGQDIVRKSIAALDDITAPETERYEVNILAAALGMRSLNAGLAISLSYANPKEVTYSEATISLSDSATKESAEFSFDAKGRLLYWISKDDASSLQKKRDDLLHSIFEGNESALLSAIRSHQMEPSIKDSLRKLLNSATLTITVLPEISTPRRFKVTMVTAGNQSTIITVQFDDSSKIISLSCDDQRSLKNIAKGIFRYESP